MLKNLAAHGRTVLISSHLISEVALTAVKPVAHSLSPGAGFAVLCFYAAAALAAGGWALARRDA